MNSKFNQLLSFTSLAVASVILAQSSANALTFSFNNTSSDTGAGVFNYNLTFDAGESIDLVNISSGLPDFLALTNFAGTAAATTVTTNPNPYTINGSGNNSANFSVNTTTTGATTLDDVITINATNFTVGTIDYSLSFSGGNPNGTITGPVAVPFEPEANVGIFTVLGLIAFNRYRKKLKSRK